MSLVSQRSQREITRHGAVSPWRDPHTVPVEERAAVIQRLQLACAENPRSADLRTCLAIAHAVNYDPYSSLASLDEALRLDPSNFMAQVKLGELWYRLRALPKAEQETLKALDLAANQREYHVARTQLQEIREMLHNRVPRPTWTMPGRPAWLAALPIPVLLLLFALWR